ncbi:hypothetical protein RH831_10620 [Halodesulfurarchaeum sp. HSR-GB]|uniref:hypothetical protein n=1 Tax=Halodesulfurarchaeum sp. HSR-GB TaxID=3074077 RepID=UPI002867AC40|nr:hypothetical protein [Halodesulfurarchaeum sp. HSR-GB]MDR5657630.1 hypothetical protein [Halodesulfurarchaeum sp. HSR-GB]
MTVRNGQNCVVSTFNQFRNKLQVSDREIAQALPNEKQQEMFHTYNNPPEEYGSEPDPVDSIEDLPDWAVVEFLEHVRPINVTRTIREILTNRDQGYTYVWNRFHGQDLHTIVELREW